MSTTPPPVQSHSTVRRVALGALAVVISVNIWTGGPLLAVWVGSRVAGTSGLSMGALFTIIAVLAATSIGLTLALGWVSARYDELTGRPQEARRSSPWLRSMSGEREEFTRRRHGISAVERIVVLSAALGVMAFELWFFFFSGSPIG
jgi:hypothetical protein